MKAYTLGIHGFSSSDINDALGVPGHIRQVSTLIVAPSKKAAAELAEAAGFQVRMSDSEFRMVSSSPHAITVALMELAGDRPTVFVRPFDALDGAAVVTVDGDGPRLVGHLRRLDERSYTQTFVALDGAS